MTVGDLKELKEAVEVAEDINSNITNVNAIRAYQTLIKCAKQVLAGEMVEPMTVEDILGVMARVYAEPQHSKKVLDASLLNSIADALQRRKL